MGTTRQTSRRQATLGRDREGGERRYDFEAKREEERAHVYYSGPPAEEELDQKSADIDICK